MNPALIDATVLKAGDKLIYIFGYDDRKRIYQNYIFELFKDNENFLFFRKAGEDKFWDMKKKEMIFLN